MHPDKIADRIAGALVDYCYSKQENPKCAFEVLIGHRCCFITGETSVFIPEATVEDIAERICKETFDKFEYIDVEQDIHLATNQAGKIRCGDNGVFAGFPMPEVHKRAFEVCDAIYKEIPTDGKIVLNADTDELTVCWSNATDEQVKALVKATKVNPLGYWTGGINVDTGITGRKLASDFYGIEYPLGGGTIHGKDLSKADCSVNIYCFLKAQETGRNYKAICSIGDEQVNINGELIDYEEIVKAARDYVNSLGGFEKLAEWGLR